VRIGADAAFESSESVGRTTHRDQCAVEAGEDIVGVARKHAQVLERGGERRLVAVGEHGVDAAHRLVGPRRELVERVGDLLQARCAFGDDRLALARAAACAAADCPRRC
jgi:hypothetical protein